MKTAAPTPANHPHGQRGVVLMIALIVLVAMSLAGIALMRSVTTGNEIAGNLAFRQSTVLAGDNGLEAGFAWLKTQSSANLLIDNVGGNKGYFANSQDNPAWDPLTHDWNNKANKMTADAAGNTVYYVIHRMARESGKTCDATECSTVTVEESGVSRSGAGGPQLKGVKRVYYRITARTVGPKNTVSYSQVFLY